MLAELETLNSKPAFHGVVPMSQAEIRKWSYIGLFGALLLGSSLLQGVTWEGSAELHTLMEVIAMFLALTVGMMALIRFYSKKNNTILMVATGFLGTGLLDGYHAIVTSSFFAAQFPSGLDSLIPWSWIASRVFLSILLWFSWLSWKREARMGEAGRVSERMIYIYAGTLTLASFFFFAFVPLPRAYYPEIFFHRPEEFVPALFFLLALIGYLTKGHWKNDLFDHWLVLSLIVGFMGQALFMSYSGQLFDTMFDLAHLLKIVTYLFVLTGMTISTYHLFRQAEDSKQEILRANAWLQEEISERTRAEMKLKRQARELERSNAELEQFAYAASHDLQEPLRMVSSYCQLLGKRYKGKLDEDADEFIKYITDGAGRMRQLIEDLLAFSRVGTRGQTFQSVDLSAVVEKAVRNLEGAIHESGAEIETEPMPFVIGDSTQLSQLFQNLIGNAIKFRGPATPRVKVSAQRNGKGWELAVADNGIGIDPEFTGKIFGVFKRLHSHEEYSGTGIGLAICKKVVERHGGRIQVESQPGQGSTFRFTLPDKGDQKV